MQINSTSQSMDRIREAIVNIISNVGYRFSNKLHITVLPFLVRLIDGDWPSVKAIQDVQSNVTDCRKLQSLFCGFKPLLSVGVTFSDVYCMTKYLSSSESMD